VVSENAAARLVDALAGELQATDADYAVLRDAVFLHFNPTDDDAAETDICVRALAAAAAFIELQPCDCTDDEPCGRCTVLGRDHDHPESR
jgi:hypothetical protein